NETEFENKFIDELNKMDLNRFEVHKPQQQTNIIENEERNIKEQRTKLLRAYTMGYVEEEEFKTIMEETQRLLDDVKRESKIEEINEIDVGQIRSISNFIVEGWKHMTVEEKEKLILSTVEKIIINFIPRELNENGNTNTVEIKKIHFIY
ncbi:hypothetical protein, partial [Streptomyces wuyuanensis]